MTVKGRVVRLLLVYEVPQKKFASFPTKLYKWITKLVDSQGRCKLDKPIVWTPELVRKLEASEDKIVCAVDHWLDRIIGGFITGSTIDTLVRYSEA